MNELMGRDVLQSDITHYLRLTSFMNRFVWFFVVSPSTTYPCLSHSGDSNNDNDNNEEAMVPPTVDKVERTTSQEFFISCLETCKVVFWRMSEPQRLLCDEIPWSEIVPVIDNVTVLFDFYYFFLTQNNPDGDLLKYKTEMVVNSILGQMSYMRLLPDLLIL